MSARQPQSATGAAAPPAGPAIRTHTMLPHTADAGFEVTAEDLPALFEEAAVALAELGAGAGARQEASPATRERVTVRADDLPGLAFAWLNELIALGDIGHGVVADVTIDRLEGPGRQAAEPPGRQAAGSWWIDARVGIHPYGERGPRAIRGVKAATYHGLVVERTTDRWLLRAYLDL